MDRGDTHSVKAGIELFPWRFTILVIIWFILLIIWFILITLHDIIILFNTLTTKEMSRNKTVTIYFEFFRHQEGNLFLLCTLHWCDPTTLHQIVLATERRILFQTRKTSFIHNWANVIPWCVQKVRQCATLMVTSLFTHIVHSEEKNCTCVEKCII